MLLVQTIKLMICFISPLSSFKIQNLSGTGLGSCCAEFTGNRRHRWMRRIYYEHWTGIGSWCAELTRNMPHRWMHHCTYCNYHEQATAVDVKISPGTDHKGRSAEFIRNRPRKWMHRTYHEQATAVDVKILPGTDHKGWCAEFIRIMPHR